MLIKYCSLISYIGVKYDGILIWTSEDHMSCPGNKVKWVEMLAKYHIIRFKKYLFNSEV